MVMNNPTADNKQITFNCVFPRKNNTFVKLTNPLLLMMSSWDGKHSITYQMTGCYHSTCPCIPYFLFLSGESIDDNRSTCRLNYHYSLRMRGLPALIAKSRRYTLITAIQIIKVRYWSVSGERNNAPSSLVHPIIMRFIPTTTDPTTINGRRRPSY